MEPYEAREITAKAWCDNSTSHLDMIPELAEAFAKILVEEVGRASPASAPEGSFNAWWNSDKLLLNNTYRKDSPAYWAWEGWCAALAAAPTPPVSEDQKDVTLKFAVREVLKWVQGDFPTEGYLREQVEKLAKERDEYKSGFEAAASKYRNLKLQMQEVINVC